MLEKGRIALLNVIVHSLFLLSVVHAQGIAMNDLIYNNGMVLRIYLHEEL